MSTCPESVTPNLTTDPCNGNQFSTDCILYEAAITYLSIPANSTLTAVLQAYLLSLVDARNRITVLENLTLDLEERIVVLENP